MIMTLAPPRPPRITHPMASLGTSVRDYDPDLMDVADLELRNATYRQFVVLGRAPSAGEVAAATRTTEAAIRAGWRRLHDAHALVLDAAGEILMANPFAAQPTPYRVEAGGRSWFANCGWDALGIGSALHVDCTIYSACPDCREPLQVAVRDGQVVQSDLVFHVLVPAASWWNDIGFT